MLSYRHSFHAGNPADVFKHATLALIIEALKKKERAFCYIDTHAGAGRYDLLAREAQKTGEYRHGIAKLWNRTDTPAALAPYLDAVRAVNTAVDQPLHYYPGSPAIVAHALRPQDRMILLELHTTDHPLLEWEFGNDSRVHVQHGDAYKLLKGLVPPRERRGLVLIDPAYEMKSDYTDVIDLLETAHKRWATGIFALWYPVLARSAALRLQQRMVATGIKKVLLAEFGLHRDAAEVGLKASGLMIVNPPHQLDTRLRPLLPWLQRALEADPQAPCTVRWLVGE